MSLPNESSLSDVQRERLGRVMRRAADVAKERQTAHEAAIADWYAEPQTVDMGTVLGDVETRRAMWARLERETAARRLRTDIERACYLGWWRTVAELARHFIGVVAAEAAA